MRKIIILPETTKNPITLIGQRAGICYGSNIDNNEKNFKRGLDCINSDHGRVLEYVNIEAIIDGYSARVIREWYTHIGGAPTRLQESTRYIDYENFNFVTPPSVKAKNAEGIYRAAMQNINEAVKSLEEMGVPREDAAMLYPLGMTTKIVDKRNLRNVIDMSHQRMCGRAYLEFRELFSDYAKALCEYSDEWKRIVSECFVPKCVVIGYCPEKKSCGYYDSIHGEII